MAKTILQIAVLQHLASYLLREGKHTVCFCTPWNAKHKPSRRSGNLCKFNLLTRNVQAHSEGIIISQKKKLGRQMIYEGIKGDKELYRALKAGIRCTL